MKFVFNKEKNDEIRRMLMMQPTVKEAEELLKKDETDPYARYVMGTALSLEKKKQMKPSMPTAQELHMHHFTFQITLDVAEGTTSKANGNRDWRILFSVHSLSPRIGHIGTIGLLRKTFMA